MENRSINFFQSANLTNQESKQHFVVRQNEFHRIISEIKRDKMEGSVQHYIVLGHRGSGKSTLLRRIEAEICTDEDLSTRFMVVNLSEEQAGIYRLYDVWDAVIEEMKERKIAVEKVLWTGYSDDSIAYTRKLFLSIQQALKREKKKLILLVDNIDRIFDAIGEESHLLRELLTNYNDVRIVGGSTRMNEHYWKYEKPFYQFFSLIRLEALTADEVKILLLYWSDYLGQPVIRKFIEEHPGKLNTIRTLTDGMPRTLLYFIQLLIDRPNQNGFDYLRFILDQATPVYQERLLKLPPAQRKIVLELSFFRDAVKVEPLIDKCKMPGKVISAQLAQLEKAGIVEKIKGLKKNNLYRVAERFFNLWLVMTQGGPREKHQVKYLTLFLESWYDQTELQQLLTEHLNALKSGDLKPAYAAMMTKALVHSRFITLDERDELINKTTTYKGVKPLDISFLPEPSDKIFEKINRLLKDKKCNKAREELKAVDQENADKYFLYGLSYHIEGQLERAEDFYLQAIEKDHVNALFNLASVYDILGSTEEAEKYYLQAIEKGLVSALYNLAVFYYYENRNQTKALQLMEQIPPSNQDEKYKLFLAICLLWAGKMKEYENLIKEIVPEMIKEEQVENLEMLFRDLLVHHQSRTVWEWFMSEETGEQLKKLLQPLYFVTAGFINEERAKEEVLKAGPELKESIEQIREYILKRQEFYYGKS